MKKQLLSTSALAAAGMLMAPGLATAQTAPASQPIQITVGGYMYMFASYVSQDDRNNGSGSSQATITAKPAKVSINHDAEIYFQGKTTLANGISVAVRVELEAASEADQIDEAYATVEGAFGTIHLGSTDNAAYKMKIGAPVATAGIGNAGGFNTIVGNLLGNPTRSGGTNSGFATSNPILFDNDSEKISYYTPRFEGFQLGLTYTPELTQDRHNNANSFNTGQASAYNRSWAAGLNFSRAFGPLDIAASAGYMTAKKPDSSAVFTNATFSDPKLYSAGLQLGYAGFRLGGGYAKVKDGLVPSSASASNGSAVSGVGITGATDSWVHGSVFDLGLTYTFGPAVVGISYLNGKNRAMTATPGDDKLDSTAISGRYQLGPGVQVEASVFHTRIRGNSNYSSNQTTLGSIDNNKATGVITGLILNF